MIIFAHGGGYVKGNINCYDTFCRRLAATAEAIIVSVDYRLAPEHPFPAALDDVYNAASWFWENSATINGNKQQFFIAGESAGGNLAIITASLATINTMLTRPSSTIKFAGKILLQPVVDFTLSFPSVELSKDQCLVPADDLLWYYKYLL